jgi:hypothetical protein
MNLGEKLLVNMILGQIRRSVKHLKKEIGEPTRIVYIFDGNEGIQSYQFTLSPEEDFKPMDSEDKEQIKKLIPYNTDSLESAIFELDFKKNTIIGHFKRTEDKNPIQINMRG